jgi:hypothetical protein
MNKDVEDEENMIDIIQGLATIAQIDKHGASKIASGIEC